MKVIKDLKAFHKNILSLLLKTISQVQNFKMERKKNALGFYCAYRHN